VSQTATPSPPHPLREVEGLPGLSEVEARRRWNEQGPNEQPTERSRGALAIALGVIREPMFLLLVAAGTLYLTMGKTQDALMLLAFVFFVMGITIVQERRSERALDALRVLSSPYALVVRDGIARRIPSRELVTGDIVHVAEGERVPADAILRRGSNLSADESLLTGESAPVRKLPSSWHDRLDQPGGDDLPSLYSGTLVTSGVGVGEVFATGSRTELGRIGTALLQVKPEPSPIQQETARIVRVLAAYGLAASAATAVIYALTRGSSPQAWKQGLLAGITMAMSILPEELPVILTVFLALGAWRISRSKVLTRRMAAIEALGAATVLCVDKTGTLTQNHMVLTHVAAGAILCDLGRQAPPLPAPAQAVLEAACLASRADPFDPMERAIHEAYQHWRVSAPHTDWTLVHEYTLAPGLLAVSHAWRTSAGRIEIFSKGAPEAIADLCLLPSEARLHLEHQAKSLAAAGLRVLAVARSPLDGDLPQEHAALRLEFLGLIGLADPIRVEVPKAIGQCQSAGIRVVMITGDYPETAQSIARQAGFVDPYRLMTGAELEKMSAQDLRSKVRDIQIFARTVPNQKLRIVQALKDCGDVVAMTGDGVNDAPALKAAHIGIAMGGRGTDVAREAASLVLLDDAFSSIVEAVALGRRIFDNIRKAVTFTVAVHVPIAGLSIIPVLMPGWPLLLLPIHIVILELIIDPSCSLVFEAEVAEANVMQRPPRRSAERLFSREAMWVAVFQGLGALAACLGVFVLVRADHGAEAGRTAAFLTLVTAMLAMILVNRSRTRDIVGMLPVRNVALWWVLGGAGTLLWIVLETNVGRNAFGFATLQGSDLALAAGAGLACLLWVDAYKFLRSGGRPPGRGK